jgi:hypothetical protein
MERQPVEEPTLPALRDEVYLLETDGRVTYALQSLVLDHLLRNDGPAVWVDSDGHARTDVLARLAPSMRLLERVRVARGFTAYQHHSLLDALESAVPADASLLVVPAFDWAYRADDVREGTARAMLDAGVRRVADRHEQTETPVVVTRTDDDDLTAPLGDLADEIVRCEQTAFGPRFVGDAFETLVYPDGDGMQTTLSYWIRVLARRAAAVTQGVSPVGAH